MDEKRAGAPAFPALSEKERAVLDRAMADMTVEQLLRELLARGGTFAAVADAQLLVLRKSADYNQHGMKAGGSAAFADRDQYFPFGLTSYAQMLHVKTQRINSLVLKARGGGGPNFEGLRDTGLDIINYASFLVERMDRDRNVDA
jgi:hypothetical protein